ncbi:MAG: glycoside hydrolase family 140 protein [Cyclobacteriaceae bacterium]
MNRIILVLTAWLFWHQGHAQIRVSDNHRFLSTANGEPFFWLGDTDWEMAHRLNRAEAATLIHTRAQQGFNVLQVVALAEFNGIREPNRYGDWPLNNEDPTQLAVTPGSDPADAYAYDYWDHLDYIIELAEKEGIYIGLLPTWGDKVAHLWGDGPIVLRESNAEAYAGFVARRFQHHKNILWILGGDRPAVYEGSGAAAGKKFDDRIIWRAMASGIERVLGADAFITYHPAGGSYSTSQFIHEDPWLDMNAFQSGHGSREVDAWNWVVRDHALKPLKPTLDMEPCYEDHPVNPWDGKWTRQRGYFHAHDVRARIYRTVFAGGAGVTYGHHQVWQFLNTIYHEPVNIGDTTIGWEVALHAEAATQLKYLRNLVLSRPYFSRVFDPSMVSAGNGKTYVDYLTAMRDENGSYAMIYFPRNQPATIDWKKLTGSKKTLWWYDPRTGTASRAGTFGGKGMKLTPPSAGDWVLVIDDAGKNYPAPGTLH